MVDIITRAVQRAAASTASHLSHTAVMHAGQAFTYNQLLRHALALQDQLNRSMPPRGSGQLHPPRIACLAEPGPAYVVSMWTAWLLGAVFVPLGTAHPPALLDYTLDDAAASMVLVDQQHADKVASTARAAAMPFSVVDEVLDLSSDAGGAIDAAAFGHVHEHKRAAGALILYTSGTTGKPKGVLHTHRGLAAQMESLCSAWQWRPDDRILHTLPLHHIHGLVNALMCAHYTGASVDFAPFSSKAVWTRLQQGNVSVFMGVPTMYTHLLKVHAAMPAARQAACRDAAAALRLTVSGSAACPLPIMERWRQMSGVTLLERYGMTEVGMALGNPYKGLCVPGTVGVPLPGVEVKLASDELASNGDGTAPHGGHAGSGELRVRGPGVFKEYWQQPDATAAAFDADGYFCTGDTADRVLVEGGREYFRILGRTSVDIIKSGGFKISALRIENVLLEHPDVQEAVVLGVPDDVFGEVVCCVCVMREGAAALELGALAAWAASRLPAYELPKGLLVVGEVPRNAMGKVNKKEMLAMYLEHTKGHGG